MADQTNNPRTIEAIQQEYTMQASRAGQACYQEYILAEDKKILFKAMRDLNLEAAAVQASIQAKSVADAQAALNTNDTSTVAPTPQVEATPAVTPNGDSSNG